MRSGSSLDDIYSFKFSIVATDFLFIGYVLFKFLELDAADDNYYYTTLSN